METFLTVASTIYTVFYTLWLVVLFIAFVQLTPWEQARCTIKISAKGIVLYMLAISWIISRWIS